VTDAELRAHLIFTGQLRPVAARHNVFAQDYEGRRVAARDIWLEEGPQTSAAVVANPFADPVVRDILRRALERQAEAAA
jgi:hypothetical protein